jgi:hypothetical protein
MFGLVPKNSMGNDMKTSRPLKPAPKFVLSNHQLFGNDAAEEEQEALFFSYAVKREELDQFLDSNMPLQIARAYKGEGKSALLRLTASGVASGKGSEEIVISTIGPDLSPSIDSVDQDLWTREWKKSILKLVANEIGAKLGLAFSDDAISLVEEAEANGFKKRSFVSAIVDRLKIREVGVEKTRLPVASYEQLISRYVSGRPLIWIVVDDVDQNFVPNERQKIKIATFFTACRQIIGAIPEIRIRTCIRPNVWAIVKRDFESLSHAEQYSRDLTWSSNQFRALLAARVKSYLGRTGQWDAVAPTLPREVFLREQALVALVFDDPMPWGGGDRVRPPHLVLWTLTGHRPRWLIELCKEAGKAAAKRGRLRINRDDIFEELPVFGRKRIEDTVAEFRSQCPQIEELLGAFSRQKDLYTTDELFATIHNRILQAVNPTIAGTVGRVSDGDVAHFLFQIGFLAGRRDYGRGEYDHIMYRDNPSLLKARTNLDDGLRWEINPVFRDVLNLRGVTDKPNTVKR